MFAGAFQLKLSCIDLATTGLSRLAKYRLMLAYTMWFQHTFSFGLEIKEM